MIQANKEFDKENYTSAKTYFDQLLSLEPKNIDFLERIGFCNQFIGKNEDAIKDFSIAIMIDPKRPSLYFFRANNLAKILKYEEAILDYLKAIELRPMLKAAHNNLGLTYFKLGQKDKACESFFKGLELGDESSKNHYDQHCI